MNNPPPPLPDQAERDRFCQQLDTNFSVIAPAGVGKTTSIVSRIVAIARADRRRSDQPVLPHLVVVTYTKKAADEMFSRVRIALDEARPHPDVHAHLAQAFFGTIHSFCQRLLAVAGPLCGIPGEVEIVTDTARLWQQFRLDEAGVFPRLPDDVRRAFARHGQWEDVFRLGENWPVGLPAEFPLPGPPPRVDGSPVLALEPKGAQKTRDNLRLSQERLQRWLEEIRQQRNLADPSPCPEPKMAGSAGALKEAWQTVFAPLRDWRAEATRALAASVASNFARYRRRTGQFTFDDLIQCAQRVLDDPEACDLLRHRHWRVILDEAQDTDPTQFNILTELTRAPGAEGQWLRGAPPGPQPGHFCMVGDPQQSIYSDRADLVRYLQVHEALIAAGGQRATFSVTMRCPVSVVETLNRTCGKVLQRGRDPSRQVDYVKLEHPAAARIGQVVRVGLEAPDPTGEAKAPARQAAYATALATWWQDKTPADFGTTSWNHVAVLCPRNGWIDALAGAFQVAGLPIRQLSRRAAKAGDPVHAWYAALLTIFAYPRDSFELYGVLRDVFGFSDSNLAMFVKQHHASQHPHPLRIDRAPPDTASSLAKTLQRLHALWLRSRELPLYEAIEHILRECQFRERLAHVPAVTRDGVETRIERFRRETAGAEAKQIDLVAWAAQQRATLNESPEGEERSDDAITFLTVHKAKGLGYDAIVLPFFFRKFSTRQDPYPCFEVGADNRPRVLFDAADRDQSAKALAELRRFELHERLLYVALTRVKRTLFVLDDAAWWADLKRQSGESWAQLLQVENEESANRREWWRLPAQLQPPPDPIGAEEPGRASPRIMPAGLPPERPQPFAHWRRQTPSSLQQHDAEPARTEPDSLSDEQFPEEVRKCYLEDPAAYGNWWHDSMEVAPWSLDMEAFRLHCSKAMKQCPDPVRGAREIHQLIDSSILSQLLDTQWEVHTEVPFVLGDVSEKIGYEGYIDLLAVNRGSGGWMILDWKTDRMPGDDKVAALRHAYAPQVEVYRRAAIEFFQRPGTVGLYSTVSGEWVGVGEA